MNLQTIEEGVYLFRGETYDSNATIFVYGGQAVMVDALASRADAAALKHWLEENLGARVRYIVATHYFSDHLAALGLFPESDIIAHRHYRHTFDSELYRSDEEQRFFVEPTLLVGDGLELRFGRFHLEIFHNPGHTMSTLCVEVPEAGLLHVGDTLVGRIAYFLYTSPASSRPPSSACDAGRRPGCSRATAGSPRPSPSTRPSPTWAASGPGSGLPGRSPTPRPRSGPSRSPNACRRARRPRSSRRSSMPAT